MSGKTGWVFLVAAAIILAGGMGGCCSIGLKNCSTQDVMVLTGDDDLNNCNDQSSIPVTVRIYYLKQKDAFMNSSFNQLWNEPDATLTSDVVDKRVIIVEPGGEETIELTRPADVAYVGIIANFCRESGSWRKVIDLESKGLKKTVNLYQVTLSVD